MTLLGEFDQQPGQVATASHDFSSVPPLPSHKLHTPHSRRTHRALRKQGLCGCHGGDTLWEAHFVAAGSPPQEEDVEIEEGTSLDSSSPIAGRRMFSLRSGTHSMALISTVGLISRTHLVRDSTPSNISSAEGCCRRLKDQTLSLLHKCALHDASHRC